MERSGFYLKTAADGDAEQIHALMRDVYDGLEDKSLYGCDDLEFVRSHITKHGFAVMACTWEDTLAAVLICRYPMAAVSPDNPASCRSLEKCGYTPVKTVEKYGGLTRSIYCKRPV